MARDYAKLLTRIWADSDFKQLTGTAQRLYFQLISQPDMSMAGVVTLAEKRWSLQVADQTEPDIEAALTALEKHRFIVVDRSTQEVLVRSFIRADGGWKSPTTMKGIDSSIRSVLSDRLKAVLRDEAERIDTSGLSETVSKTTGRSTKEYVEGLIRGIARDFADLENTPTDTPSDTPSDTPCDGHKRILHTTEPEPAPATAPATATATTSPKSAASGEREDITHLLDLLDHEIEANGNRPPKRNKTNHDAMRLLIDRDGYTHDQIAWIIRWCQQDNFWQANILSAVKLREKFTQLVAKSRAAHRNQKEDNNIRILQQFVNDDPPPYQELTS